MLCMDDLENFAHSAFHNLTVLCTRADKPSRPKPPQADVMAKHRAVSRAASSRGLDVPSRLGFQGPSREFRAVAFERLGPLSEHSVLLLQDILDFDGLFKHP